MNGRKRIGFVSTRLAGTDGVSLETDKWSSVLERDGYECYFMAGELDTPPERSLLSPKCHFNHPDILATSKACFGVERRDPGLTRGIERLKHELKDALRDFVDTFDIDLLIPENALAIPLNLSLGLAITEFIMESGIPAVAHHHDLFWERKRFLNNACWDYLGAAFPPHLFRTQHVVINSSQRHQLSLRRGIAAEIIPNVMDFANPPPPADDYADDLRANLGLQPEEKLILQPTRIVQRKGIEHAIELVHRLGLPARLVVSHASGDEGYDYYHRVLEYSELLGIEPVLCSDNVGEERGQTEDGRKIYTLADLYRQADMVTYPSAIEGFGNAFLEAVYFRRPIMVNNYSIYSYDIKPKGFRAVEMDGFVSKATVDHARRVLEDPELARGMADHNYELALRFFSYELLQQDLRTVLADCFGMSN